MNFAEMYRSLLKERLETDDEIITYKEPFIKDAIRLFCRNIPEATEFLKHDCTANEYIYLSEIIEEIAAESESLELIQTYADLVKKYPEETKDYNMCSFINSALAIAEPDEDEE